MPRPFDPRSGSKDYWRKVNLDPDLLAIAALTGTGYAKRTAADTWILDPGTGGAAPHNLLDGSTHPDTVAQSPNRGSLIKGDSGSPCKWDELVLGAAELPLHVNTGATDLEYSALKAAGGGTGIVSYAAGDIIYASGATALAKLASNPTATSKFLRTISGGSPSYEEVSWDDLDLTTSDLADLAVKSHASLSAVTSDQHHPKVHALIDLTNHPESGLTIGHVVRATGAATYAFGAIQASDLPDVEALGTSIGAERIVYSDGSNLAGDADFLWDGTSLLVGRTTSYSSGYELQVNRTIAAIGDNDANLIGVSFGGDAQFIGFKSGGTEASPTALPIDTRIMQLRGSGNYDTGPTWATGGYFEFFSNEAWSFNNYGTRALLSLCADGAASPTEVARFRANNTKTSPLFTLGSGLTTGIYKSASDALNFVSAGNEVFSILATEAVVNQDGLASYDFRVASATRTKLFWVDTSAEKVAVGDGTTGGRFSVIDDLGAGWAIALHNKSLADGRCGVTFTADRGDPYYTYTYHVGIDVQGGTQKRWEIYDAIATEYRFAIEAGGNIGLGLQDPVYKVHIYEGGSSLGTYASGYEPSLLIQDNANASDHCVLGLQAGASGSCAVYFGDTDDGDVAGVVYDNSLNTMILRVLGNNKALLDSTVFDLAVNLNLNGYYADIDAIAVPATPGSGTRRLFCDSTNSDELSVKKSDGSVVSLESGGGSISGSGAAGQVTFWTGGSTLSGDNDLFWDSTDKCLCLGTTTDIDNTVLTIGGDDGYIGFDGVAGTQPTANSHMGATISTGIETLWLRPLRRFEICLDYTDSYTDSHFKVIRDAPNTGTAGVVTLMTVSEDAEIIAGDGATAGSLGMGLASAGGIAQRFQGAGDPANNDENRVVLENTVSGGTGICSLEFTLGALMWDASASLAPGSYHTGGGKHSYISQYINASEEYLIVESKGHVEVVLDNDNDITDGGARFRISRNGNYGAFSTYYLPGSSLYGETVFQVTDDGLALINALRLRRKTITGNFTLDTLANGYGVKHCLIAVTTLTTALTVTLPSPSSADDGRIVIIKDETGNAGTYNISVSQNVDGSSGSGIIASAYGSVRLYCPASGTTWFTW